MAGEGAEAFAERFGLERVENSYFDTEKRREALQRAIEREKKEGDWTDKFGTVGAAALDTHGHLGRRPPPPAGSPTSASAASATCR